MHRPFDSAGRSARAVVLLIAISTVALGPGGAPTAAQSSSEAPLRTPATLPPDGSWQADLSAKELIAAGSPAERARAGTYTWTFAQGRAMIEAGYEDGGVESCVADVAPSGGAMKLTYFGNCAGSVETISWALDESGLHLSLSSTDPGLDYWKAILEAKAWQAVDTRPIPSFPPWQSRCEPGCQGPIAPGTFTSTGFLPGLEMTFADDAWFNTADYHDEIEFDSADTALRFWQTASASSEQGEPLPGVPVTPEGLTDWFVGNTDMVVSEPETVTLGEGIAATTFNLRISDTNVNVDPGCPSGVRSCLNVLWIGEGHVFAIGYGSAVRLYLFTLSTGSDARTIVISLDAPDEEQLTAMTAAAAPILGSIRIPRP